MRPAREIFMHDLKVVFVIEFVGRKDAELVARFEKGNRDHQVLAKVESMRLREGKIISHVQVLHRKRANSR